jgi:hypothetical protein
VDVIVLLEFWLIEVILDNIALVSVHFAKVCSLDPGENSYCRIKAWCSITITLLIANTAATNP